MMAVVMAIAIAMIGLSRDRVGIGLPSWGDVIIFWVHSQCGTM